MDAFRTPDERFETLPDFPWKPKYHEWEGLRLAYVDEGEGQPVVLFHGEPSWSFLYRKVMAVLLDKGYRCVAVDLPGFGRSDKPTDLSWYTYDRHTQAAASVIEALDLHDAVFVVQDWGGPVGLRIGTLEAPERVSRFVAMDTGLFTGRQQMSAGWHAFRDFVERTEDLPIGMLIENACATEVPDEVIAAYEAPFPTRASKAGARAFPLMLPLSPDQPGAAEGQAVADALRNDRRPALLMWGDSDPALPLDPVGRTVQALFPTAEKLTVIHDGGHFLQEDQGHEIGALIADWLANG
ncbi:MAG TPA: haloalkane dehalogenase [Thermoleophilaceae bacterium]|nr:haloalkane dehalogenase [Thermoleophilaceae bacterium]